jgi:NADPH2:quinone reductase
MKAAFIRATGDPSVIQFDDLPDPIAGENQVLVRVASVAVNPIDTYIRSGDVALPLEFPWIIGCDLAGEVLECGRNVTRCKPGDRVWGSNQSLFGRAGTFSELAAVDECWLYPTAATQTDDEAAAGSLVGITAHLGLFLHANLQPNELVFVNGGSGGVGSSVIQLAKAHKARVITTVGSDDKKAWCESLGADLILNYKSASLDEELTAFAEQHGGIDVWFETLRDPNPKRTIPLMARRGRIVVMAGRTAEPMFPIGPFYVKDLRMCGFAMFNASHEEQRICAEEINRLAAAGHWQPNIGEILPLARAAQAHQLQEDNTLNSAGTLSGKIVLNP